MSDFDTPPPPAPSTVSSSQGLIARVQAILLKPIPTWDVIATETGDVKSIYMSYVLPLAAITPIAHAIGMSVIGVGAFGISYHTPIVAAIVGAIVSYVLALIGVYIVALVIDGLAPSFDGQKNFLAAFKVAAYSSTATWVAGIVGILPSLGALIFIAALYGLYLMYTGLPRLMKSPPEKTIVYMIVIAVVTFVMMLIIGVIGGAVTGLAFLGSGGGHLGSVASVGGLTANGDRISGKVAGVDLGKLQQATEQMAAEASAQQNGTSTVKLADAQALLALTPENFMGAARSDVSTGSGGMGTVSASTAKATYVIGDGSVTLTVSDIGTMGGLGAMAAAMNVNTSSSSATGYEKITTNNGVMTSEKYDTQNKSGEYAIVNNGRISVTAEGNGVDINTLKQLVASVDIGKAQSLAQ